MTMALVLKSMALAAVRPRGLNAGRERVESGRPSLVAKREHGRTTWENPLGSR
jgi:hypothetical protein